MAKRISFILLILLILGAIGYYYVNKILLPVKFKAYVLSKAEEILKHPVSFSEITFNIPYGFTVKNIQIDRLDKRGAPLISIPEARFNVLLPPILSNKNIVIPTLRIKKPFVHLVRDPNKQFNITSLLNQKTPSTSGFDDYTVYIRKLIIDKGEVNYLDQTQPSEFTEYFKDVSLAASINIDKTIDFAFHAAIEKNNTSLNGKGSYFISNRELSARVVVTNFMLSDYYNLYTKDADLRITRALLTSTNLKIDADRQKIQLQGQTVFSGAEILFNGGNQIKGDFVIQEGLLTQAAETMSIKGKLLSPSLFVGLGSHSYKGNLTADVQSASFSKDSASAQGLFSFSNAAIDLGANGLYRGNFSAQDFVFKKDSKQFVLNGNFLINSADFKIKDSLTLQGNIKAGNLSLSNANGETYLQTLLLMEGADISDADRLAFKGDILTYGLKLKETPSSVSATTFALLKNTKFRYQNIEYAGNPSIDLSLDYSKENTVSLTYTGSIQINDSTLKGIPRLGEINNIAGKILFKDNLLHTERLTFNALEIPITLKGSLTDFAQPRLDIKVSNDNFPLAELKRIFPEKMDEYKIDIAGTAAVLLGFNGPVQSPLADTVDLKTTVNGVTLKIPQLKEPVQNISGEVLYSKDTISWNKLSVDYQNKNYALDGELFKLARPTVRTTFFTDNLKLNTKFNILHGVLQFENIRGSYYETVLDLYGDVFMEAEPAPQLNLRGGLILNFDDLPKIVPPLAGVLDYLQPKGKIQLSNFILKGTPGDWKNWQLYFEGASSQNSLMNWPLKNVTFKYSQRDQFISQIDLVSTLYDGTLNIKSSFDISKINYPFTGTFLLENLNLKTYRQEHKTKNQHLAGNFSFSAEANGSFLDTPHIKGKASLNIVDGFLGQLIPQMPEAIFSAAKADFTIENRKFNSTNALIYSETALLEGKGWVDFDQNINFVITPVLSEKSKNKKSDLDPTQMFSKIINIKATGTLSDPKINTEASAAKIIGNTTGAISEGVGLILDEIF